MKHSIKSYLRSLVAMTFLFSLLSFSNSCSDDPEEDTTNNPPVNQNEITMPGSSFSPASLTVAAGTRVTWRNTDSMIHTVTSDSGLFDSGNITRGGSFSFTFTNPGTYPYHCNLHTGMTGAVVVN